MDSHSENARIVIREATDKGYPSEVEGPGGEFPDLIIPGEAAKKACALTKQLDSFLGKDAAAASQGLDTEAGECLRDLGQYLFETLNADDRMRRALDLSPLSPDQRLRIQLRIRDAEVESWPWELLYDVKKVTKEGELDSPFLALSPRVFLSRYHEQPIVVPQPEKLEKLRVLVIVASPQDRPSLDQLAHGEIESLKLLDGTMDRLELHVFDERVTPKSLLSYMTQVEHPFHVVHFIGHGYFEASTPGEPPETGVILEKEDGYSFKVEAQKFAKMLRESQRIVSERSGIVKERVGPYPRLVILYACHSARTTSSVANTLVDCGLPAVIGMRYPISPPFVTLFNSKGLYAHLLDGYPIDRAIAECRRRLNEFSRSLAWSIPTLYLRARDGILFARTDSKELDRWLEQLQLLSELAESPEEAIRALFKFGASAIALSVAAVLAHPLAAVRAGAAALLRALPRTPEVHDNIINLIGPAVARETDIATRREMTRVLAQPRVSSGAEPFLNELARDPDPEVRDIVRASLTVPTSGGDLDLLFDHIHNQLERATTELSQLSTIVNDALQREVDYSTYLQQVEDARNRAIELQRLIAQAQRDAASMTADQVWDRLSPQVAEWIENANRAIAAANQAGRAAHSLASSLTQALDEVAKTLEFELDLMKELDEITLGLDGTIISDAQGDATIEIVRRAVDIGGKDDVL